MPHQSVLFSYIGGLDAELPVCLKQSKYHCGRHFDVDELIDTLGHAQEHRSVALVSGKLTLVYKATLQGKTVTHVNLVAKIEGHLGNRHRRGGQSAPRFQRLNDEARVAYLKKIQACVGTLECMFIGTADWATHFCPFVTRAWHESEAETLVRQLVTQKAIPDHTEEAQAVLLNDREKVYGITAVQAMSEERAVEVVYAKPELLEQFPGAKCMNLDLNVFAVLWPGMGSELSMESLENQ